MSSGEDIKALFDQVIKNTHDSLKWSWQIVMGFALVEAVRNIYLAIFGSAITGQSESFEYFPLVLFFFVFLPAFVRFFYGDNRYLDLHYLELTRWKDPSQYINDLKHRLSKARRIVDTFLLLTHGIVFVFLSNSIGSPHRFFAVYAVLMVTNSIWLFTLVKMNEKTTITPINVIDPYLGTDKIEKVGPRRDRSPKFWIKNNLVTFFLMLAAWMLVDNYLPGYQDYLLYSLVLICFANSAADLWTQREFYFPSLDEKYYSQITGIEMENNASQDPADGPE